MDDQIRPSRFNGFIYRGRTALHLAVERGHDEVVRTLIKHDMPLRQPDRASFTPLHIAAELGHDKIVAQLLAKNATLADDRTKDGLTALHLAAIGGRVAIVEQLILAASPLFNATGGSFERTALHFAAQNGHEKIVAMLMQSVSQTDSEGKNVLHFAAEAGHDRIVVQLIAQHRSTRIAVTAVHFISRSSMAMSQLFLNCLPIAR